MQKWLIGTSRLLLLHKRSIIAVNICHMPLNDALKSNYKKGNCLGNSENQTEPFLFKHNSVDIDILVQKIPSALQS